MRRRERQSSVNGNTEGQRDSVLFQLDSFNEADKSIRTAPDGKPPKKEEEKHYTPSIYPSSLFSPLVIRNITNNEEEKKEEEEEDEETYWNPVRTMSGSFNMDGTDSSISE